jgi:hypothetical protein
VQPEDGSVWERAFDTRRGMEVPALQVPRQRRVRSSGEDEGQPEGGDDKEDGDLNHDDDEDGDANVDEDERGDELDRRQLLDAIQDDDEGSASFSSSGAAGASGASSSSSSAAATAARIGALCRRDLVLGALCLRLPLALLRLVDPTRGFGWQTPLALPAWRMLQRCARGGAVPAEHLLWLQPMASASASTSTSASSSSASASASSASAPLLAAADDLSEPVRREHAHARPLRLALRAVLSRIEVVTLVPSGGGLSTSASVPSSSSLSSASSSSSALASSETGADSWRVLLAALRFATIACQSSRAVAAQARRVVDMDANADSMTHRNMANLSIVNRSYHNQYFVSSNSNMSKLENYRLNALIDSRPECLTDPFRLPPLSWSPTARWRRSRRCCCSPRPRGCCARPNSPRSGWRPLRPPPISRLFPRRPHPLHPLHPLDPLPRRHRRLHRHRRRIASAST